MVCVKLDTSWLQKQQKKAKTTLHDTLNKLDMFVPNPPELSKNNAKEWYLFQSGEITLK